MASISSPLPVAWYPSLVVVPLLFLLHVCEQPPLPLLFFSHPLCSCLIWILGSELFSGPVALPVHSSAGRRDAGGGFRVVRLPDGYLLHLSSSQTASIAVFSGASGCKSETRTFQLLPVMAKIADEDSSTGIDLICAICDNGGEIARFMMIFPRKYTDPDVTKLPIFEHFYSVLCSSCLPSFTLLGFHAIFIRSCSHAL